MPGMNLETDEGHREASLAGNTEKAGGIALKALMLFELRLCDGFERE